MPSAPPAARAAHAGQGGAEGTSQNPLRRGSTVGMAVRPPSALPPFLPSFLLPSLPPFFPPFLPPSLSASLPPTFFPSLHEPDKYLLSICHLPDITHYLFTI